MLWANYPVYHNGSYYDTPILLAQQAALFLQDKCGLKLFKEIIISAATSNHFHYKLI